MSPFAGQGHEQTTLIVTPNLQREAEKDTLIYAWTSHDHGATTYTGETTVECRVSENVEIYITADIIRRIRIKRIIMSLFDTHKW